MLSNLPTEIRDKLIKINQIGRFILTVFLALVLSVSIHFYFPLQAQTTKSPATLIRESKAYYDGGQFRSASIALEKALQISENADNQLQQAQILSLLSLAYEQLGKKTLVEQTLASSISLLNNIPETPSSDRVRARVFNRQGRWQLARGPVAASLETLEKAELLYTQADDFQGIVISKLNQAQALQMLGFSRRATEITNELFQQLQDRPPSAIKLSILNSLGNAYRQQGDLERSEQILTQALTLARNLNLETSKILLNLGNINSARATQAAALNDRDLVSDRRQQALEYYREAEAIATFPIQKVRAQLNQFSLLVRNERLTEAKELLQPIANNLEQLPSSRSSIYARINFANGLMMLPVSQAKLDREKLNIVEHLQVAIAQSQALQDKRAESYALGTLGQFYEARGQTKLAIDLTRSAVAIAQNLDAPELNYKWQWQLGRLLVRENRDGEAIQAYEKSIADLQLLRFDIASTNLEVQFSFRDSVEPVYRQYMSLLLLSPQPSQDKLQKSIEVLEELKIAELDNLFQDACARADNVDIKEFDDNTAIIYPLILPDRLELILKLPQQDNLLHYSQSNVSELEINNAVEQLQNSLIVRSTSPSQLKQEAAQFYDWLIRPFASELETASRREASQIKNLVFVLDGALRNIPMSALYDGQNYLVARYGVAISPGVQLVSSPSLARENLEVLLAGAVDSPSFQAQELAPLDNVAVELAGIAETIGKTKKLENQEFQQTNIQEQINRNSYNIVHIATHGKFSSNSQETYILDWNEAIGLSDLDRILEAEDFQKAKTIDLLVLSACETATGDRRAALGLAGVAVRSGASSTVASLWQVNDASTAEFMIEFYRQLNNPQFSKAEALRNVQLNFIARSDDTDYNRPYHWASFILVGDWR